MTIGLLLSQKPVIAYRLGISIAKLNTPDTDLMTIGYVSGLTEALDLR